MEKIYRFSLLSNARENILLAAVSYLLNVTHSNRVSDVIMFLVVLLFLLQAGVTIIRATDRFKWDKVILVFSLCWAFLKIGLRALYSICASLSWLEPVLTVINHITIVLAFVVMLIMIVLSCIYLTLEKKGKWNYDISANQASMNCFDDYLIMGILIISCAH